LLLKSEVLTVLNKQIAHEASNEQIYRVFEDFFAKYNLHGFEKLFASQAKGEYQHRQMLIDYVHEKNNCVEFLPIKSFSLKEGGELPSRLVEIMHKFLIVEEETTKMLYGIYEVSEKSNDYGTCAWLNKPDGLILEQIEEEGLAQDMISRAELVCKCQSPNIGVLTWDMELLARFN
jgi:ferritin